MDKSIRSLSAAMKQKFTIYNLQFTSDGFTLVELLVVISIIGILIGLSIFGLQGARESARDANRKADLQEIRSGLEIYKADCGSYPSTLASSLVGTVQNVSSSCSTSNTYISEVPLDPVSSSPYSYNPVSTDNGDTYTTYTLCAALEQTPNPTPDPNGPIKNCNCGSSNCNYFVQNP
jgi:general secretion pathway protein G